MNCGADRLGYVVARSLHGEPPRLAETDRLKLYSNFLLLCLFRLLWNGLSLRAACQVCDQTSAVDLSGPAEQLL